MSDIENITSDTDPWAIIAELQAEIARLREENAELRAKLNTNSTNSSLPPSQDLRRPTRERKRSDKKRGGQPGHRGHKRKLYTSEEVSKTVDVRPNVCPNCEETVFDAGSISIECRQVVELPEIRPEVTQYNIHTCRCGKCGKHVKPEVPKEAERGYGPRLMGFVTTLMGVSGISKRKICALMGYLGLKIPLGSLCNIHRLASEILEGPYNDIRCEVLSQSNVHSDETSWRSRGKRSWVWVAATPTATFFRIDPSRSQAAFARTFGGFQRNLTSDRYSAYNVHKGGRQVCLAHIKRDWVKVSEREGLEGSLGKRLLERYECIFELWHKFKSGDYTREQLQRFAEWHIEMIRVILKGGAVLEGISNKTRALCYGLLDCFKTLWTFLYEEGVEPTNNLAERALRPMVIWRKLSGGTQSEWGDRLNERLQTIVFTLKQQMKNIFEYLTDCFRRFIRAGPDFGADPTLQAGCISHPTSLADSSDSSCYLHTA